MRSASHRRSRPLGLRAALLLSLACPVVSLACPAEARAIELSGFFAADLSVAPEPEGHGILQLALRVPDLAAGARLTALYNTDTLRARLDQLCLGGVVCLGFQLEGEYRLAGILTDYYRRGEKLRERAFEASYLAASADAAVTVGRLSTFRYGLTGRRWFFDAVDTTADDLRLPPEAWVLEHRLGYTFWAIAGDRSWSELHRPSPRVRGLGFGIELGLDQRSEASAWGAPGDPRNRPRANIFLVREWARAGLALAPAVRLQASQWAGWGRYEDDLTRARIGGSNPYAIPSVGTPWPAFLASRFVAGELAAHFSVIDDVELGPLAHAVFLEDVERTGDRAFGAVLGVGAFVDARLDDLQLDLKGGWSLPLDWAERRPHVSIYLLIGYRFL